MSYEEEKGSLFESQEERDYDEIRFNRMCLAFKSRFPLSGLSLPALRRRKNHLYNRLTNNTKLTNNHRTLLRVALACISYEINVRLGAMYEKRQPMYSDD